MKSSIMNKKDSVENLLIQFFEEEKIHSTKYFYANLVKWGKNCQEIFEDFVNQVTNTNNDLTTKKNSEEIYNKFENVRLIDDNEFENMFRMKRSTFEELENELRDCHNENDENMKMDLLLALFVLGSTESFSDIGIAFGKEESEVLDVCIVYYPKIIQLSPKYVYWPTNAEMTQIMKSFEKDFMFPGVIGILGNLHVSVCIDDSIENTSQYFNEGAGNHTVVLQAVCDNNYIFRDIFVGHPGGYSAKQIFNKSPLHKRLTEDNPFLHKKHLLGGTMHPQLETLLTPYKTHEDKPLKGRKLTFNVLHNNVMTTIERTFELVQIRFPRITCLDIASPKFATMALGVICTLHNFASVKKDSACINV